MDRTRINFRINKIQEEIPKLTNTLNALYLTDSDDYPQNYEELSIDAALRAEQIACFLRNLIFSANLIPKPLYMQKVADVHGIVITTAPDRIMITLPGLMPKRKRHKNSSFITEPLYQTLADYSKAHKLPRFRECVVCFSHQYDRSLSLRRILDYDNYDNQECKQILDVLATFLMIDDTGFLCDIFHCTQLGSEDCTILTIMEKQYFPLWLKSHKKA